MNVVRVLLIPGSLREGSTNVAVLRTAAAVAPAGVTTTFFAGAAALPHFTPDADPDGGPVPEPVADLRAALHAADAVLICTPEYAGALPSAFKNVLEWTVGDASTYRKRVGWINASGPAAPSGGADAHDSLRKVLGYVGAEVVEGAVRRLPVVRDQVGPDGLIADADLRAQIAETLAALAP